MFRCERPRKSSAVRGQRPCESVAQPVATGARDRLGQPLDIRQVALMLGCRLGAFGIHGCPRQYARKALPEAAQAAQSTPLSAFQFQCNMPHSPAFVPRLEQLERNRERIMQLREFGLSSQQISRALLELEQHHGMEVRPGDSRAEAFARWLRITPAEPLRGCNQADGVFSSARKRTHAI